MADPTLPNVPTINNERDAQSDEDSETGAKGVVKNANKYPMHKGR